MSNAMSEARTELTGTIKWAIGDYIPFKPMDTPLTPPLLKIGTTSKADRGFRHPTIGRLMCPLKYLEEFDKDPEYTFF